MLKYFILMIVLTLTGCGGGEQNANGGIDDNRDGSNIETISGGTVDKPVYLKLGSKSKIKNNYFYNYFKYKASENEQLILHASLEQEFSRTDWQICNSYGTDSDKSINYIRVYDENLNVISTSSTCTVDLKLKFPLAGTYIIHYYYPKHSGYAEAASVTSEWLNSLPNLSLATTNKIHSNTFENYYKYNAKENENLIMHSSLGQEFSRTDWQICNSYGTDSDKSINYIRVYDENLNVISTSSTCDLDFTVEFPTAETYIVHYYYPKHSGYVEARSIN